MLKGHSARRHKSSGKIIYLHDAWNYEGLFVIVVVTCSCDFYFEIVDAKAVMKRMEVTLETDSASEGKHELQFQ